MEFVESGKLPAQIPGSAGQDPLSQIIDVELSSGKLELPVLPTVASEVLGTSLDDQSDAARLATLIQQDQSLAGHVMRVVNSPAYRGNAEIVALKQAIARLGLDRIREIALAASLGGGLFQPGSYQSVADASWKLALAAGLWSKEVARACRKNVEIAYLCGLLHNIGVPLVLQLIVAHSDEIIEPDRLSAILTTQVTSAGSLLAKAWHLPEAVTATTEYWCAPASAGKNSNPVMIANAGVRVAELMLADDLSLEAESCIAIQSIQELNLYPQDVEQLLECRSQIESAMEAMHS